MTELHTSTAKYFYLAIREFLPRLEQLKGTVSAQSAKEEVEDLIEAYNDIALKLRKFKLNCDDPNKFYDGEPHQIELALSEEMIENLARLTHRLLLMWQEKLERLKRKVHQTEKNRKESYHLGNLIWPLEAVMKEKSYVIGKYADKGPLEFPGAHQVREKMGEGKEKSSPVVAIFPATLIKKIPKDVAILCDEFNANYQNGKPYAGLLLLRRILPLAVVRKFQQLGRETEIQNDAGEFMDTKALLGKVEGILSSSRIYKEIIGYKSLVDGSQHSYSLNIDMTDAEGAAIKIRIFLDDIF